MHNSFILCSGQAVSWEDPCRIKHLPTRLYLAVVKGESGKYEVSTCSYVTYSFVII